MMSSGTLGCLSMPVLDDTKDCDREEEVVVSLDSENVDFTPLKGTYIGRSASNQQPLTENELSTQRIRDGFKEGFLIGTCLVDPSSVSITERSGPIMYRCKAAQKAEERGLTPPISSIAIDKPSGRLLATENTSKRYSTQQKSISAASQRLDAVKNVKSQRRGISPSAISDLSFSISKMPSITKVEHRGPDGANLGLKVTNETNQRMSPPNFEQNLRRNEREPLFGDSKKYGSSHGKKQTFQRALGKKRNNSQKRTTSLFG